MIGEISIQHLGTRTIETKRLILREFKVEDAKDMFQNWAGDTAVTKYLMWPAHRGIETSKEYIEALIESYQDQNSYNWGIELKELGQVIGSIGVVKSDSEVGYAHVGYCIGKNWWQQGITSEAFRAVIDFLIQEVGFNRIESRHDPRNENSGKVMLKCGLRQEGILRQSDSNNQGICDAAWYSILREDYLAHK